jgi:hypothetical protein
MQRLLNAWYRADPGGYEVAAPNIVDVEFLRTLQAALGDAPLDDAALTQRLDANYALLESFAGVWRTMAAERDPALGRFVAAQADGHVMPLDIAPLRLRTQPVPVG